jgi:arsenite oxidase small subunit
MSERGPSDNRPCLSRRAFLLGSGTAMSITLLDGPLSVALGPGVALQKAAYPRKRIARVSQLREDQPVTFQYPWKDFNSTNMLVKLGTPAGAGVGPDRDIVAFSSLCSHMGGPLVGQYRGRYKVLGPCPFHLTTFDLTRYGMVVAGQATESLPQIVLETQDDEIWATGVMGLIYGYHSNLVARG